MIDSDLWNDMGTDDLVEDSNEVLTLILEMFFHHFLVVVLGEVVVQNDMQISEKILR